MNRDDGPARPVPSNPSEARSAAQSLGGLRDLAVISFVVVLGPLLIYAFWRCLSNWGRWRVRNARGGDEESGRAANLRRQYVRTWHGWVERQYGGQSHRDHEVQETRVGQFCEAKGPRPLGKPASLGWAIKNCLRSKTATTDYNRIFWDRRTDREEELRPRYWWQKWLNGNTDRCNNSLDEEKGVLRVASSGCDLGESGTVRRRVGVRSPTDAWISGSDEIRRATQSQLLQPRKCIRSTDGGLDSSRLVNVSDNNVKARKSIAIPWRSSSLPHRAVSRVQFPTPPLTRRISAALRCPGSVFEDVKPKRECNISGQEVPFPQTLEQRPRGEAETPYNSPELPTPADLTPVPGVRDLHIEKRASPGHVDGPVTLAYEAEFANSLGRRLEIWASPMILDPFTPSNHGIDGTAGRRASPAMGWCEVQDRPGVPYGILNHEAEGSANQSTQPSSSSSIRGSFDWSQKGRTVAAGDGVMLTPSVSSQGPIKRHDIPSGFSDEARHAPLVRPFRRRESFPAHHRTRPDRTLHASIARARSAGSVTDYKRRKSPSAKASRWDTYQARSFTSSERTFLDLLDRKLNWLHHELSPGFRCPEDNPAESYRPFRGPQQEGGPGKKARVHTSSGPGSSREPGLSHISKARQRRRAGYWKSNPKLDSWRVAMNNLRKVTHGTESVELLRTILQVEEGVEQETREGAIDTAAWVLRRPPQGWPTDSGGNLGVGEEMIVKHQDWEKIRRPQRIMKRKYPRKNTTRLGRKLSGNLLKVLRIGSDTTATGKASSPSKRSGRAPSKAGEPVDGSSLESQTATPRYEQQPDDVLVPVSGGQPIVRVRSPGERGYDGRRAISKGRNPYASSRMESAEMARAMAGGLGIENWKA
ncbi:hypothetical protein GP486_004030 [Trichoglossum hirsutum]|uniref:Uncharacterized protein n=1 Tax=Trichoglossum hirsutum TaxID=265104 RepID=A0A9P8LBU1_9PEZI|nr:hypothetical protein GP486_004030 [Trichoglossum hirsutum]